ncbi:MAG: conjugal transfer protein TraX [Clostridia bacterium]|nr:conjugal transfer protein TraX [Clostridia bacterium]
MDFLKNILFLGRFGRLAFPIFAFQIANGFSHTKSKEKYIIRMLIFTIISQIPYDLFLNAAAPGTAFKLNVGATLTTGLLALYVIDKIKHPAIKMPLLFILFGISWIVPMDYSFYGFLAIIIFYIFKDSKFLHSIGYAILLLFYCHVCSSGFNIPAILALIPICLYNGQKGKNIKYLFYAFYPLHMLFLTFLISH